MLDLSALEASSSTNIGLGDGKPLDIALDLIHEDPNQPRKEFDVASLTELAASLAKRQLQPIVLRPHPDIPGEYIIKVGARRTRAARLGKLTTIKAIIDDEAIDAAEIKYDQVKENLQRDDLTPIEYADFIAERLASGEKKSEIAKQLNKDATFVTHHLALHNAPAPILNAYQNGCTSAKTLYELRRLLERAPHATEEWLNQLTVPVTRENVTAFANEFDSRLSPGRLADESTSTTTTVEAPAPASHIEAAVNGNDEPPASEFIPFHNPEIESDPETHTFEPVKIKKPLVLVTYQGSAAMLLLNRRPTTPGMVFIRYEADGSEAEVDAGRLKINLLTEAA